MFDYEPIDDNGRIVTLRKFKFCEWCGVIIKIGEKAVRRVYCYDECFNDTRQHPECFEAMKEYGADYDYDFEPMKMVRGKPLHHSDEGEKECNDSKLEECNR